MGENSATNERCKLEGKLVPWRVQCFQLRALVPVGGKALVLGFGVRVPLIHLLGLNLKSTKCISKTTMKRNEKCISVSVLISAYL